MSGACAALNDFNFSSEDSSSLEEDEKVNYKKKEGQERIFAERLRL
jgi:hypothetical protein